MLASPTRSGSSLRANGPRRTPTRHRRLPKRPGNQEEQSCKKGDDQARRQVRPGCLCRSAQGLQSVPAGTVEVKVHASSKAIKALKAGHTLHVSGTFTFQSALGGPPVRTPSPRSCT